MNKNIFNAFIVGSLAMGLASCSENSWNDHYLDGFEGGVDYDDAVEGTYALTAADYSSIASIMQGKATTDEEKAAAKAIGTKLYFDKFGIYPAQVALPGFLDTSSFPYYLASNGSVVDITYQEASEVPAELTALAGAKAYTVTAADYKTVWGSDENYIKGFAPVAPAASNLPAILAVALPDVDADTYAVVSYEEASTNPVFGNISDEGPKVYIDETFAEGFGDFTIENVIIPEGSTYVWKHDTYKDDSYLKASGFVNKACRVSEGWVISPEVALSAKANAVLSFEQAWNKFGSLEEAKNEATVWVRVKGGSWNQLTAKEIPANDSYTFYPTGDIDLSAYNGKTVQIGFCYKSTEQSAGTWELKNLKLQDGGQSSRSSRAVAAEVPTEAKNAVYAYNGSKWAVAEGVVVLNPSDYTAMGFSNNKLTDPEIFIPLYLRNKLPYALSGAQEYVVYNGTKVDLFVFDGTKWTLNNNGLETVTGRFQKKDNVWSFVKYVGKAIFSEFNEAEIIRDRTYLLVSGDICAVPVNKSSNYGYLQASSITISGGQIVEKSDVNGFTFAASYEDDDKNVTQAPDGQFLLRDSNGRYLYMSGTYSSANLSAAPTINDGKIADQYLWTATPNGDGTWSIKNVGNNRVMAYSSNYGSFGVYESLGANDVCPSLYILGE